MVLASQLLLDECVSAKRLGVCVCICVCNDGANDPHKFELP